MSKSTSAARWKCARWRCCDSSQVAERLRSRAGNPKRRGKHMRAWGPKAGVLHAERLNALPRNSGSTRPQTTPSRSGIKAVSPAAFRTPALRWPNRKNPEAGVHSGLLSLDLRRAARRGVGGRVPLGPSNAPKATRQLQLYVSVIGVVPLYCGSGLPTLSLMARCD
jgi:hypothetical protein